MQRVPGGSASLLSRSRSVNDMEIDAATPADSAPSAVVAGQPQRPPLARAGASRCRVGSAPSLSASFVSAADLEVRTAALAQSLTQWIADAYWPERSAREVAADRVRAVFQKQGEMLDLFGLNLTCLPPCLHELATLRHLNASSNRITALAALPTGLTTLQLTCNQLVEVGDLPASLQDLDVSLNNIVRIRNLPAALTHVYASHNQLAGLPALPDTLQALRIGNNQIVQLPALPVGFSILIANRNRLTHLPALPPSLRRLYVQDNPLGQLPYLPVGLTEMFVDEAVHATTYQRLMQRIGVLTAGFDPQMQLPVASVADADAAAAGAQPVHLSGFGDLAVLPPDILKQIGRDFEPGAADAARLAGASKDLHAFLRPRLEIDREIALARQQIDLLRDLF